jgi:parallel beta-helix repeat protein
MMGIADTVNTQKTLDLSDTYVIGLDTNIVGFSVKDPIGQTPGAAGDGVTNDYLAIYNAQQRAIALGVGLYFPPGRYNYGTSLTFSVSVTFAPGAVLAPTTAYQTTFNAPINALPVQIFSSTLASAQYVSINGLTPLVYAEWFGALGNGSTDDSTAINAALASNTQGGIIQLLARAYKIGSVLNFVNHSTTLQGSAVGPSPYDGGGGLVKGTQILGASGVNGISVYNLEYPTIRNLGISLAVGASIASIGVVLASTFNAKILDVRVTNYGTGIQLNNANTDVYIDRVYAASTNATLATIVGIDINGTTSQNASVYISNTICAHSGYTGAAYGFWLHGTQIADAFFDQCEADTCTRGYFVDGSTATANYNMDIHMRGCIADSIPAGANFGFYILNLASAGNGGALEIVNGWVSGGNASSIGVYVAGSSAHVRVSGMQLNGSTGLAIGIYFQNGNGGIITDNVLLSCANTGIVVDANPDTTIANNQGYGYGLAAMGYFIQLLTGSNRATIMGNVARGTVAGAISTGIATPAGCDYCNVIGNCMDGNYVSTCYSLALGSNTHSYQAGTTA